jgi:hypothetical protein
MISRQGLMRRTSKFSLHSLSKIFDKFKMTVYSKKCRVSTVKYGGHQCSHVRLPFLFKRRETDEATMGTDEGVRTSC